MDTVLNNHTTSIIRQPPEDTSSIFLRNTAPQTTYFNQDRIIFLHHCQNLKKKLRKSVDGSCLEHWMTSAILFSLPTQYLMLQCFAPLLCYSFFYFPKCNRKGKKYNKIKTSRPFWNAKYVDGFTVNTSVKVISNSQKMSETSITTYTMKHNKFW